MSLRTPTPSTSTEAPSHSLRADWEAAPSRSPERRQASAALRVLSETSEATPEAVEETPPLPESLRARWEEAYGRREQAPHKVRTGGFIPALREWFSAKPVAWAGAGMAAALLAVMFSLPQKPAGIRPHDSVVTRGTGAVGVVEKAAPVYVIVAQTPA